MNLEDIYRLLRSEHVQAQGIVDTVQSPLLVLDQDCCILSASRSFFETFKVNRDETIGQSLFKLGNGISRNCASCSGTWSRRALPSRATKSDTTFRAWAGAE